MGSLYFDMNEERRDEEEEGEVESCDDESAVEAQTVLMGIMGIMGILVVPMVLMVLIELECDEHASEDVPRRVRIGAAPRAGQGCSPGVVLFTVRRAEAADAVRAWTDAWWSITMARRRQEIEIEIDEDIDEDMNVHVELF